MSNKQRSTSTTDYPISGPGKSGYVSLEHVKEEIRSLMGSTDCDDDTLKERFKNACSQLGRIIKSQDGVKNRRP